MVVGFRRGNVRMALGRRAVGEPGRIARVGIRGVCEGEVISVPLVPQELLEDQERALDGMTQAVRVAGPVQAVGLGSLLSVVAGRGVALGQRVSVPVTTGNAATAWAAWRNVHQVLAETGHRRVALLGFSGGVGRVLAELLAEDGVELVLGGKGKALEKRASKLGFSLLPEAEAAASAPVVVGAATTGGTLDPQALQENAVVLDVALPPTLQAGPRPTGVRVLAGEAVSLPKGWARDGWGQLYHLFAGYGPWQLFACLAEPLVLAHTGRDRPFAQGARVHAQDVRDFGTEAVKLGFSPRLARGWMQAPA